MSSGMLGLQLKNNPVLGKFAFVNSGSSSLSTENQPTCEKLSMANVFLHAVTDQHLPGGCIFVYLLHPFCFIIDLLEIDKDSTLS